MLAPSTAIICAGCFVAFGLGTAVRFGNLINGFNRAGLLSKKLHSWLFPSTRR